MRRFLLFLILIIFISIGCTPRERVIGRVFRVIDGDTIEVTMGGAALQTRYKVRYIGIDSPERGEPLFEEAAEKNRELVENKTVRLEKDVTDTDRYERLLCYVYVDGLFVNGELVRLGYARAVSYHPDVKYQERLSQLEEEARRAGRGIWRHERR